MEDEDLKLEDMRDLFAGIALPGVIGSASLFDDPSVIASRAYDISEAMMAERTRRIETKLQENESNN